MELHPIMLKRVGKAVFVVPQHLLKAMTFAVFLSISNCLLGSFAQLERDIIVSRTTEGRERAQAQGKRFGRPNLLNSEQSAEVERLFNSGCSKNELSKKLNVSRMTISRVIDSFKHKSP